MRGRARRVLGLIWRGTTTAHTLWWLWTLGGAVVVSGLVGGVTTVAGLAFVWTVVIAAGLFLLAAATILALAGRATPTPAPVTSAAVGTPQPAALAEPSLASAAADELQGVRDALVAGELEPNSAEVANALQRAHVAIHGPGRRVAASPVYIPQLSSTDLIVKRIDEVIQRLRLESGKRR